MFPLLAIGSILAGAAISANASSNAAKRQQGEARASQQRQLEARNRANQVVMKKAEEFDPVARNQRQAEITQGLEAGYNQVAEAPAITAQGVEIGQGAGPKSQDYLVAQAREQAKNSASMHELASIMARQGSAGQLRRNEAVGIGDTAGEVGRIQNGANNVAGIDQIGIEAAGQPSVGQMMLGQALSSFGSGSLAGAGMGPRTNDMGMLGRIQGGLSNAPGWWLKNGVSGD